MATAQQIKLSKKIKPMNDKILISKAVAEEKSEGGIYLPSGAQEKPLEGIVIAVGPGALSDKNERQTMQLKEGDKILYSKYSGTEIKVEGYELLILSEKEVLAVIEG
jgi:chaperonin GroES